MLLSFSRCLVHSPLHQLTKTETRIPQLHEQSWVIVGWMRLEKQHTKRLVESKEELFSSCEFFKIALYTLRLHLEHSHTLYLTKPFLSLKRHKYPQSKNIAFLDSKHFQLIVFGLAKPFFMPG